MLRIFSFALIVLLFSACQPKASFVHTHMERLECNEDDVAVGTGQVRLKRVYSALISGHPSLALAYIKPVRAICEDPYGQQ